MSGEQHQGRYDEPQWIVQIKQAYPRAFHGMGEFMFECDEGWRDLIQWALARMAAADPKVRVSQVKEKFGCLRIYARTNSKEAQQAIIEAEALSARICEHCGGPGFLDASQPRLATLCDECSALMDM